MKKISMIIIVSLFLLIANSENAMCYPPIEKSIKIAADNHLPPYSYVNDNGIFKGFYLDIIRAIAIETGIDIELHPMPWHEIITDLMITKEIDAVLGPNIKSSKKILTHSDPILTSYQSIFVRKDNKYIVNLEDLRNAKVAIHKGNVDFHLLQRYVDEDEIVYVDQQQQGIQMIMMGQVDAFIGDKLSGLYTIQKWKQENFIKIVGESINESDYGITVRTEDEEIAKIFNIGLLAIKNNGTYDKIYLKWFGETIQSDYKLTKNILTFMGIVIISIIIVGLFIIRWNASLKKEVYRRTLELDKANKKLIYQKVEIENNNRFKEEILNSQLYGIVTLNRDKEVTFINSKGIDILKDYEKNIIGKDINLTILSKFFIELKLANVLNEGKYYRGEEIEIVFDDNIKTFNCNLYPLKKNNEIVIGAILNFRDISNEKKIKAELARRDKIQALGLMVAGLAHEIRNPLTSIKTFIDLIPTKIDNIKFRNKLMEIVPSEINRLNSLITNLLEYSKPKKLNRKIFNVKELLESINFLFFKRIKDKNINFSIQTKDDINVFGDKYQIQQVFINLILNSIDAVSIEGNIKVFTRDLNNFTEITIEDDGCGISKEDLEKVMDPFFTTKHDGTGLGLFISYQIIQENSGFVNIQSKLNEGTKVSIILPSQKTRGVNYEQYINY